jgi:ribonuclease BN (tRNA processing enzyme)
MRDEWTSLSWRIESDGKVLAVSGDTGPAAPLADLCAGADLFVCECTTAERNPADADPRHLSVADIARLRPLWTARRVALTHLSGPARAAAGGLAGVEVADDGTAIEI